MNKKQKEIFITIISELASTPEHEIKESSELYNDLGFDSLDYIELIMEAEREFNISIPDECAEGVKTVKEVMDLISIELNKQSLEI